MPEQRPNILCFMTDQQQADVIHPDHPCQTPNVQRLIDNGVLFTNHYTQTAHCCPSRASFMTGHYPTRHGVWNNISTPTRMSEGLKPDMRCFSEDLRESGYDMAYAGKWHVSGVEDPVDRGWDELMVTAPKTAVMQTRLEGMIDNVGQECLDDAREPGMIWRPGWGNRAAYGGRPDAGPKGYEQVGDYKMVQTALEHLPTMAARRDETGDPWMLYVGPTGPHDPFIIPEKWATMYDPDDIELPESFWDTLEDKPTVYQRMRHMYWGQMNEREVRESIAHYWGYCSMEDAIFGEVLDRLEATGQLDDTIIMYTSDHGDYCGAHWLYAKGVPCFREAYNVPLAVSWANGMSASGEVCDEFTCQADMAQTFREIAGCDEPESGMPGRSILPLMMSDRPADWREEMHTQFNGVEVYYTQRQVFTHDWKYVYNAFDFDELYDLKNDPNETVNLAAPCRHPRGAWNVGEKRTAGEFQPWPELPADLNAVRKDMLHRMWKFGHEQQDTTFNAYCTVALAPYGPAWGYVHRD